jgi:hypothetical protein
MAEPGSCARLLALIDALRVSSRDVSLPGVILFLHVCENDGIAIKDLVYLSGYGESLVSRAVDRLRGEGNVAGFGGALVTVSRHPASRLPHRGGQGAEGAHRQRPGGRARGSLISTT